jgi:hypothetical protein
MRRSDKWGHPTCRHEMPLCGKLTTKRLQSVLSGASISCGCLGKQKFTEHWRTRVAALSNREVESIWCAVWAGTSIKAAARDLSLNSYLVSFAAQAHQRRLDSMDDRQWHSNMGGRSTQGNQARCRGIRPAATVCSLRRHQAAQSYSGPCGGSPESKPDPSGARQHEFTRKELARKLNGQFTGTYGPLFLNLTVPMGDNPYIELLSLGSSGCG